MLALSACSRVEWGPLEATAPSQAAEAVIALHLRPSYFEAVTAELDDAFRAALDLSWTLGSIEQSEDKVELLLGPLSGQLSLTDLSLVPDHGAILLDATYVGEPIRASIRHTRDSTVSICRVEIDLHPRHLEVRVAPHIASRQPQWQTTLHQPLSAEAAPTLQESESCAFDLASIDWPRLATEIDRRMATQAAEVLLPTLQALFTETLAFPQGGFTLHPVADDFFAAQPLRLATWVSASRLWSEGAFAVQPGGLDLVLDLLVSANLARCMDGLVLPSLPVSRALAPETLPETTPSGQPYDLLMRFDQAFLEAAFWRILRSGLFCAELRFDRAGMPPLATTVNPLATPLFPELSNHPTFAFGRSGLLRLQLLTAPRVSAVGGTRLRLAPLRLRYDFLGEAEDLWVTIASAEVEVALTLDLEVDGPLVRSRQVSVEVLATVGDAEVARAVDLSADAVTTRLLRFLAEEHLYFPVPTPFGKHLRLLELASDDVALQAYGEVVP